MYTFGDSLYLFNIPPITSRPAENTKTFYLVLVQYAATTRVYNYCKYYRILFIIILIVNNDGSPQIIDIPSQQNV